MVDVVELNTTCKSAIFKSVLTDLIYSFRMSINKLTGARADVRLDQIRANPIAINGTIVVGRIRNLVGGKMACAFDKSMLNFLEGESCGSQKFTPAELFAIDFFDCFSSVSKDGLLELNTNSIETSDVWSDINGYYIRFDTKIISMSGDVIPSKFVVSVDEITSMYFRG